MRYKIMRLVEKGLECLKSKLGEEEKMVSESG